MNIKSIIDNSPPYLLAVAAAVCLCLSIVLTWQDRVKAAALLSGLFMLCVILAYFPRLDSINAFSINVKLRQSLDRADEILTQIRKVSIGNAKAIYMNTAWGGRWGGMSARDKQELLDSVNEQLLAVGVSDGERKRITQPHVELIGYDLYDIFYRSVRAVLLHFRAQPGKSDAVTLINDWDGKQPSGIESIRGYLHDGSTFIAYMKGQIPGQFLDVGDYEELEKLTEKIGAIFDSCLSHRGYTEESLEFFDKYQKEAARGLPEEFYDILIEGQ